jgi:spermidine/putrescine transport system permease protein
MVKGASQIPVVNSEVVTACALAMLLVITGMSHRTIFGLYVGHITLTVPFVVLSVLPKLKQMDGSLYEAALDLGATPTQALFKVVIPEILPGIFSGFMLAVTLSLDDYIVTATLSPLNYDTISTAVYKAIALTTEKSSEQIPIYRALTTIIFLITVAVVVFMNIRARNKKTDKRKA